MASLELPPGKIEDLRADAWLGDAVLELYVRAYILRQHGCIDAEMKTRFTSNQFLNSLGNPTRVEAAIGQLHQRHGLQAALDWIQQHVEPLFLKQEAKKRREGKA
jgi:dsRNA-specific ribonuclease